VIELIITTIEVEPDASLQVTVAERHSPHACTLSWEHAEVEPGFLAALQAEARLATAILVGDAFFARSPQKRRAEFVARLRRANSRQAKTSPWGRFPV
jgi:hypothetical protein